MRRFLIMVWLCIFTCNVFAQALPVSRMQSVISGVTQSKMANRGFAANDPRFGSTLVANGSLIAGGAAAAAMVTAAAITAPAWVTAAATVALGGLFAVGIDLVIDGTIRWAMNSDGTVTNNSASASGAQATIDIVTAGIPANTIVANSIDQKWTSIQYTAPNYFTRSYWSTAPSANVNPSVGVYTSYMYWTYNSISYHIWATDTVQSTIACPGNYSRNGSQCVSTAVAGPITPTVAVSSLTPQQLVMPANPVAIAQIADSAWKQAAAKPDYYGVPYDVTNPITTADVETFISANPGYTPTVGDLVSPQPTPLNGTPASPWTLPIGSPSSTTNPSNSTTPVSSGAGSQLNLGPDPGIVSPTLEATPSAQSILDPLLNSIPGVRSFVVPAHSSTCPTWAFSMWDHQFAMDGQCQLAEQVRTPISATMLLFFALAALLILLSA